MEDNVSGKITHFFAQCTFLFTANWNNDIILQYIAYVILFSEFKICGYLHFSLNAIKNIFSSWKNTMYQGKHICVLF